MNRCYLGLNAGGPKISECLFGKGKSQDLRELSEYLAGRYNGTAMLCKNGRSALCLALKAYFNPGDKIIVNGFTCYAVYEAIVEAGMAPVFVDINAKNLNFDEKTLEAPWKGAAVHANRIKGIIVQNSLGNPVDMEMVEKFAKKHGLLIVEDLAHSAGVRYPDGREIGTVGVAAALSFGKDKAVNAISGGAVILRDTPKFEVEAPFKAPRVSDHLRARFYPLFCGMSKGLNGIHLGGALMKFFLLVHWVERSADNRLSLIRRPSKFQAKIALSGFKKFRHRGEGNLRDFYLVKNREEVLKKLRDAGYFFDSFWYEKPVSPTRYYKEVKFPEEDCPVAMEVTKQIINFPKYYTRAELAKAHEIIKPYLIGGQND